ncbi:hypothetical protein GCM10017786_54060 [Amycolatopsis deserti]|uniref:Uncharacterized protein n=1 Tax=Amycolatopsis deserti TaxID=185696 RepID=A0ABQ3JCN6_9PSEU|nr:hypothetical protein [Amycolatopsis deserti]GHF13246.1 hypothetical protein GCM10017786_54060 [Amycolatopsis deserti]
MGGLAGLALFFGVLLSGVFFKRGNVPLGVCFALVAAAPVVFLLVEAVRNRWRAVRRPGRDLAARRAVRLAGGAALAAGAGAATVTFWWASRIAAWGVAALGVVVAAVVSLVLVVSAVRVLLMSWRAAAVVARVMYALGFVAGLCAARALTDFARLWPMAALGATAAAVASGVLVLQKRALRELGGPPRSRRR